MKTLKNGILKTLEMKIRSFKGWRIFLALMLIATFAAVPSQLALADSGGVKGHTIDVTFTKWITAYPNMAGVVGGAVRPGTFRGEILSLSSVGSITKIDALYHIIGSRHSFTAHVYVTEDDSVGTAVIVGRVIEGWREGASLTGEYKVWAKCPIATPGNSMGTLCFQGTLHIQPGSD
jgi:hypothetical protein